MVSCKTGLTAQQDVVLYGGGASSVSVQGALLEGDDQLWAPGGYGARPWQKICASRSHGLAAREHVASGSGGGSRREPSTIPRVTASTKVSRIVGRLLLLLLLLGTTARLLRAGAGRCWTGRMREVLAGGLSEAAERRQIVAFVRAGTKCQRDFSLCTNETNSGRRSSPCPEQILSAAVVHNGFNEKRLGLSQLVSEHER